MRVLSLDGLSADRRQLARSGRPDPTGRAGHDARSAAGSSTKFGRPDLDSEYKEPRDDVERTLVGIWEELLGVAGLGVRDNFFDLGGHSLIAVRLFAMIKKTYKVDFPISVLFEAPTIEGCAELIREAMGETGADRRTRLRAAGAARPRTGSAAASAARATISRRDGPESGAGGPAPPFFLVAGMFGNVLNLRHLATLVGADRPFYGLQARGLYGDEPPHETFEEMAAAYIEEIRSVQPHGPYSLGGFSGGGLTAFEIAHQLRAAGESIGLLLLLDSRLPQTPRLSKLDRAKIQWQRVRQRGPGYLLDWARNRAKWQMEQIQLRMGNREPARAEDQFHNEAIERAFRAALPRYPMRHYPGPMVLFRPKLDRAYVLGSRPGARLGEGMGLGGQRLRGLRRLARGPRDARRPRQHGARAERARDGGAAARLPHGGPGPAPRPSAGLNALSSARAERACAAAAVAACAGGS